MADSLVADSAGSSVQSPSGAEAVEARPPSRRSWRGRLVLVVALVGLGALTWWTVSSLSEEFHAPSLDDFFPPAIWFEGTWFEINRIMLVRFVALAALLVIVWLAVRRARLVPGRLQSLVEMGLEFVRKQIAIDVLGEELGRKYFPILATILFSVVFFNITGVIPFLNIAGTSVIGLPLILALWVYALYIGGAVKKRGLGGFLKSSLLPPGVPWPLYLLMTPIEALQVFILRPATLTIRLLANMMAGHMLLALAFSATNYLLFSAANGLKIFGVVTLAGGFAFFALEVFVAALQGYIFAMLTAVYLQMSLEPEH